jgi:hypothetical protein
MKDIVLQFLPLPAPGQSSLSIWKARSRTVADMDSTNARTSGSRSATTGKETSSNDRTGEAGLELDNEKGMNAMHDV